MCIRDRPVSDQLMIHLVSPSPLPELTQDNAGRYMKDITPKLDDHTIKIAAAVSLKDAVYALSLIHISNQISFNHEQNPYSGKCSTAGLDRDVL